MQKFDSIIHLIKTANRTNSTIVCINNNEKIKMKAIAESINTKIKLKNIKEIYENQ